MFRMIQTQNDLTIDSDEYNPEFDKHEGYL